MCLTLQAEQSLLARYIEASSAPVVSPLSGLPFYLDISVHNTENQQFDLLTATLSMKYVSNAVHLYSI